MSTAYTPTSRARRSVSASARPAATARVAMSAMAPTVPAITPTAITALATALRSLATARLAARLPTMTSSVSMATTVAATTMPAGQRREGSECEHARQKNCFHVENSRLQRASRRAASPSL